MFSPQLIVPALLVPLIGYRFYRRFRANVGKQPVEPSRKVRAIVIWSLLGALFLWAAATHSVPSLEAAAGGLIAGFLLGVVGLRLTQFHSDEKGLHYTPNPYIGIGVTMLLVARFVYRMFVLYSTPQLAPQPGGDPFAQLTQSPLTLSMITLTVGYYLMYTAGVLYRSRGITGTSKNESNAPPV